MLDVNQRGDTQQDQVADVDEVGRVGTDTAVGVKELQVRHIAQARVCFLNVTLDLEDGERRKLLNQTKQTHIKINLKKEEKNIEQNNNTNNNKNKQR